MSFIFDFFARLFGRRTALEASPEMPWQVAARQIDALIAAFESSSTTATCDDEETP